MYYLQLHFKDVPKCNLIVNNGSLPFLSKIGVSIGFLEFKSDFFFFNLLNITWNSFAEVFLSVFVSTEICFLYPSR